MTLLLNAVLLISTHKKNHRITLLSKRLTILHDFFKLLSLQSLQVVSCFKFGVEFFQRKDFCILSNSLTTLLVNAVRLIFTYKKIHCTTFLPKRLTILHDCFKPLSLQSLQVVSCFKFGVEFFQRKDFCILSNSLTTLLLNAVLLISTHKKNPCITLLSKRLTTLHAFLSHCPCILYRLFHVLIRSRIFPKKRFFCFLQFFDHISGFWLKELELLFSILQSF